MEGRSGGLEGSGGLTIVDLIANGTMSAEVAAVLWAAVDAQVSFLTVAVPRNAGKSTTSNAVLALRPPGVPLHEISGDASQLDRLKEEKAGGYLVVAEFSRGPMPGYIWGEPVRKVFDTMAAGYSVQSCLHAPSVADAIEQVTRGNGVPDEQAAALKLVIYIEMFGRSYADVRRRVAEVFEVQDIRDGRPVGQPLFQWRADSDDFEKTAAPQQFGADAAELERRAEALGALVRTGRRSAADVAEMVAEFPAKR